MNDRMAEFWNALGKLTFAEAVQVAGIMRDAADCMTDFEVSDAHDWSFLLNTAREIAEDRSESAE